MDFKSKMNQYLNFTKEQPVFLAAAITFSYLLVFKAQQGDILEYILFSIVIGYTFFLQTKNMFKKDLKDQILETKVNFVYDIYKENEIKSGEYDLTRVKINKLEEKLKLIR
jgi:hypothetical protein